jgi:hypothetical protein
MALNPDKGVKNIRKRKGALVSDPHHERRIAAGECSPCDGLKIIEYALVVGPGVVREPDALCTPRSACRGCVALAAVEACRPPQSGRTWRRTRLSPAALWRDQQAFLCGGDSTAFCHVGLRKFEWPEPCQDRVRVIVAVLQGVQPFVQIVDIKAPVTVGKDHGCNRTFKTTGSR